MIFVSICCLISDRHTYIVFCPIFELVFFVLGYNIQYSYNQYLLYVWPKVAQKPAV